MLGWLRRSQKNMSKSSAEKTETCHANLINFAQSNGIRVSFRERLYWGEYNQNGLFILDKDAKIILIYRNWQNQPDNKFDG